MKRMYLSIIQNLLAAVLQLVFFSFAAAQVVATTEAYVHSGLVSFETSEGKITVTLPSALYHGEIVSGTVKIEPKGANEKQQLKNADILNGFMICLPEKDFLLSQSKVSCEVPAAEKITMNLFDKKGALVKSQTVDLGGPQPMEKDSVYNFPPYLVAGLPAKITGPFDGYFFNSYIYVNGEEAKLLAESHHELIFEVPAGLSGPQPIDFSENDVTKEFQINVVGLSVEASQQELAKDETAELQVQISGLRGLNVPVSFRLLNENPDKIKLEGGDNQLVSIDPVLAGPDGSFTKSFQARATNKGKLLFSVSFEPPGNENDDLPDGGPVSGK